MGRTLAIAHLTWLEARRRRIVLAAVAGGLLFLLVFGVAIYFIERGMTSGAMEAVALRAQLTILTLAGLYVINFLTIAVAILLAVDTLAGEIGSGVMQTLASKPVLRAEIVLGKWLAYWLMTGAYLVLMAGGVLLIMRVLADFSLPNAAAGLPLIWLGATALLTTTMVGGVRFTTITNGMVAFALYGLAFVGGWIEQVGTFTRAASAQYIGTAISLLSPADAMWRRAAYEVQPPMLQDLQFSPFSSASLPSAAMIVWTVGYVIAVLALALHLFRRRAL